MDVRLSDEQKALRDSVARVADHLAPKAIGELDDVGRADKLEAAVDGAGWRELRVADEQGAPLASAVEVAIVAEELSRGLADAPFLGPTLAGELRRLAGVAPAEGPETVALSARLDELGRAVAIDAANAGSALVLVPADGGRTLGSVPVAGAVPAVDLTRPAAPLDPDAAVEPIGGSLSDDDLLRWTALGLAVGAADLVGTMRGAIALACDYAKERRQYGSPIGSFQAVQHLLADALVAMEGSRSVALHAAWAVDALPPTDALAAAALAKAYSARAVRTVCETAIQVHGGIGNTWECLAHAHLRRGLMSSDVLGGAGTNLERVLAHRGIGGDRGLR